MHTLVYPTYLLRDAFREYLIQHYATSSRDLRFHPLDAVPPDSVILSQGSSHWNAGSIMAGEMEHYKAFNSYYELIGTFALDLATLEG
jgi:hypothetical protein